MTDKLKNIIEKEFNKRFQHFGECRREQVIDYIYQIAQKYAEEQRKEIKNKVMSQKEFREMTHGCFYQDELRENYRRLFESFKQK